MTSRAKAWGGNRPTTQAIFGRQAEATSTRSPPRMRNTPGARGFGITPTTSRPSAKRTRYRRPPLDARTSPRVPGDC